MISGGFVRGNPPAHWHSIDTMSCGLVAPQQTGLTSATWPSANMAIYSPVIVRYAVTIVKLWVSVNTTGTGDVDVGLFTIGGVKLTSSGAVSHGTTSTELVSDVTDVTISPGIYYLGVSASNNTDTFWGTSLSAPVPAAFGFLTEASAHALPTTATFAVNQTLAWVPLAGMLLDTVVA